MASSSISGGTFNLIDVTMRKMGIEVTFGFPRLYDGGIERSVSGQHPRRVQAKRLPTLR